MNNKFKKSIFCKILNFSAKFKTLIFFVAFLWIFIHKSFYLVHFHSSYKISGQTDKMPRNESTNKISPKIHEIFLCICTYIWNLTFWYQAFKVYSKENLPSFWEGGKNDRFYSWYFSLLSVKFQTKRIKCLEMRAKIKS